MLIHIMPGVQHLSRTSQFLTTVTNLITLSPRMRRIALTAASVTTTSWPLGSDIAVVLQAGDREVRRRYTVRSVTDDTLLVDAVLHGHGPGSSWAAELQIGDPVSFFGPRGEIALAEADWLLALTDESGLPAIGAVAEELNTAGRGLSVFAEISDAAERYPLPSNVDVQWLVRQDQPAGYPEILSQGLAGFTPGSGTGYAYVLGESRASVTLRDALSQFGLNRESVYAKGYWNLNARPTR